MHISPLIGSRSLCKRFDVQFHWGLCFIGNNFHHKLVSMGVYFPHRRHTVPLIHLPVKWVIWSEKRNRRNLNLTAEKHRENIKLERSNLGNSNLRITLEKPIPWLIYHIYWNNKGISSMTCLTTSNLLGIFFHWMRKKSGTTKQKKQYFLLLSRISLKKVFPLTSVCVFVLRDWVLETTKLFMISLSVTLNYDILLVDVFLYFRILVCFFAAKMCSLALAENGHAQQTI